VFCHDELNTDFSSEDMAAPEIQAIVAAWKPARSAATR
jgi:hypothetical protein